MNTTKHPQPPLRLDVVRPLLCDLETATLSGQHYVMGKVIGLLGEELAERGAGLSELQRRAVRRAIDELESEQHRLLPDTEKFAARCQLITDVLALA